MKRFFILIAVLLAVPAYGASWRTDINLRNVPTQDSDTNLIAIPFVKIGKGMFLFMGPTDTLNNQPIHTGAGGMFCTWQDGPAGTDVIIINHFNNQEFWAMIHEVPCRASTVGECSSWKSEPNMIVYLKQSAAGTGGMITCSGI